MKRFSIELNHWLFEWDADYGPEHRRGWSVAFAGSYIIQLAGFWQMIRLLWIAKRTHLKEMKATLIP